MRTKLKKQRKGARAQLLCSLSRSLSSVTYTSYLQICIRARKQAQFNTFKCHEWIFGKQSSRCSQNKSNNDTENHSKAECKGRLDVTLVVQVAVQSCFDVPDRDMTRQWESQVNKTERRSENGWMAMTKSIPEKEKPKATQKRVNEKEQKINKGGSIFECF